MEFVINQVSLGHVFLQVLVLSLVSIFPPLLHTHSFINPSLTQHNLSNGQHHYITHLKINLIHTHDHMLKYAMVDLYTKYIAHHHRLVLPMYERAFHIHTNLPASNQMTNLSKNFHIFSTRENPSKYISSGSQGIHFDECSCRK